MQVKREVIVTGDGSKTIHMPEWNENYHSSHGALQEARHVFIKYGLEHFQHQSHVSIVEVGFGTGLNAILACEFAQKMKQQIAYDGIEAFPVSKEEIAELAYDSHFSDAEIKAFYTQMHASDWDLQHQISPYFSLIKIHQKLEDFNVENEKYDLVFFDAFGPRTQAEMWDLAHFKKLFSGIKSGGCLVTYCAKGQVKRDLKAAGFEVEVLPGPPGKREMTRAWKRS